jgi:amino acid transporter
MAESSKKARVGIVLRRNYLSALENLAQSIGTMGPVATIGTVLPLLIYKSGNGTWLLFLGILVSFCLISSSINVFASRFTSAGSLSAFAEIGLGKWVGSLTGWSYIVAMAFVVISSGVSSAFYLSMVVTHFTHRPVGAAGSSLLTVLVVLAAWWPAYRDIKLSTKIMLAAESVSVVAIVFILGAAMARSHTWVDHAQLGLSGVSPTGMRLGFVLAFMTLAGFESTTTLGEEAKAAKHTLPRVMMLCIVPIGVLFIGSLYCLTALSHSQNLALDQSDAPLDMIAQSIGLPTLGWLSSLGVAVSCYGCALGGFNAGSRVIFSMARSRQLWRYFEGVHPVNGTPSRAISLLGGLSVAVPCAMIGLGVKMSDAMDYTIQIASFGFLGGYLAVCVAAPVFLARKYKLRAGRVLVAVVAVAVIGAAFFLSLFPVPDGPLRNLPYMFGGLVAAGMILSWRLESGRQSGVASVEREPRPAG